jgi:hypothetical protein
VRLILPGELAKHAISEGTGALSCRSRGVLTLSSKAPSPSPNSRRRRPPSSWILGRFPSCRISFYAYDYIIIFSAYAFVCLYHYVQSSSRACILVLFWCCLDLRLNKSARTSPSPFNVHLYIYTSSYDHVLKYASSSIQIQRTKSNSRFRTLVQYTIKVIHVLPI